MTRSTRSPHSARAVLALACVVLSSLVPVAAASAQSPPVSFNGVKVTVVGGEATAVANCINAAKAVGKIQQVNQCQNAPIAVGGAVALDHVNVVVQGRDPKTGAPTVARFNDVSIEAKGGDATAVAQCTNQGKSGKSDVTQVNICTNAPTALGGTVVLTNVDIKVGQVIPGS